ncbi:MAG: MFS transporter [Nitrospirae bacterium]|nr:MAG: MFS transporter [Nitrospirota bacterium]
MSGGGPRRFAAFYFTYFAALGVFLPYFNLYCESLGLASWEIGLLSMGIPLGRVLFSLPLTHWADRTHRQRGLMRAAAWGSVAAATAFLVPRHFPGLLLCMAGYAIASVPLLPLVEAVTLEGVAHRGWDYGRIRLWGTLGFICLSVGFGRLLDRLPLASVLVGLALVSLANAVTVERLPAGVEGRAERVPPLVPLLRRPSLLLFLGACVAMQASHGTYYAFFSIYLHDLGVSPGVIGLLWGLATVSELVVMAGADRLVAWLGEGRVMAASLLLAAVRWGVYAATPRLWPIALAQTLHAFTFGTFHVAAIHYTHAAFPKGLRASGQSLYSLASFGVGMVVGYGASGLLYDRIGPRPLFAASALLALAAALATLALGRPGEGAGEGG